MATNSTDELQTKVWGRDEPDTTEVSGYYMLINPIADPLDYIFRGLPTSYWKKGSCSMLEREFRGSAHGIREASIIYKKTPRAESQVHLFM